MKKLLQLWELISSYGLYVDFAPLAIKNPGLQGLYVSDWPGILLDLSLLNDVRKQKCTLAEEFFHHLAVPRTDIRSLHAAYQRYEECHEVIHLVAQDERRALRRTTDWLMPDAELCHALEAGCRSCHDLAEWFNVTEWIVYKKMGFLKMCFRRQGLKVKGRDLFNVRLVSCSLDPPILK